MKQIDAETLENISTMVQVKGSAYGKKMAVRGYDMWMVTGSPTIVRGGIFLAAAGLLIGGGLFNLARDRSIKNDMATLDKNIKKRDELMVEVEKLTKRKKPAPQDKINTIRKLSEEQVKISERLFKRMNEKYSLGNVPFFQKMLEEPNRKFREKNEDFLMLVQAGLNGEASYLKVKK